jgi:Phosphate-selective porin O and P
MEGNCAGAGVGSYTNRLRGSVVCLLLGWGCLLASTARSQAQESKTPPAAPQPQSVMPLPAPSADATTTPVPLLPELSGNATTAAVPPSPSSEAPQSAGSAATSQSALQPAGGTDTTNLETRIHELEATVQQMQTQLGTSPVVPTSSMQVPPAPADGPDTMTVPIPPAFNPIGSEGGANALNVQEPFKGFYLESPDKAFSLRFTGQIQLDYREFLNTKDRTDIDTFLLRRARFGLEATLAKYYEFRFLPDFGQGTSIVQDAYMNIHYCDEFQPEVGRFKQPISYEQLIQDRYVPTLERSLMDQLVPARDLGAMVHGENVFGNRLDYAVSFSNGEINGNSTDLNNHKDVDGRIAVRPLNDPDNPFWMRYVSIGVSGGFGIEQEAVSPATLKMPDTVPFMNFNSTVRADRSDSSRNTTTSTRTCGLRPRARATSSSRTSPSRAIRAWERCC